MKSYYQFLNESIKDHLKPMSKDEIRNKIFNRKNAYFTIQDIFENDLYEKGIISEEEIRVLFLNFKNRNQVDEYAPQFLRDGIITKNDIITVSELFSNKDKFYIGIQYNIIELVRQSIDNRVIEQIPHLSSILSVLYSKGYFDIIKLLLADKHVIYVVSSRLVKRLKSDLSKRMDE